MNTRCSKPRTTAALSGCAADPYRWASLGVMTLFFATLPVLLSVVYLGGASTSEASNGRGVSMSTATGSSPATPGEAVYLKSCAVCHGPDGEGVPFLGKPLRNSEFVQTHSDEALFDLIVNGRAIADPANTTGALMPPRGAQALQDDSINAVVDYLRGMQAADVPFASVLAWELKSGSGDAPAVASIELTDHAGYQLYVASCAACHGQGAEGIEGLGLPLSTSGFVLGASDTDMVTFIKTGRPLWDPSNTTGLDMPPKGGNPAITDAQLQVIVDYLRALQKQAMVS